MRSEYAGANSPDKQLADIQRFAKKAFPVRRGNAFAYLIRSLAHTRQYMCALMMGMIYQFTQNGFTPDCHAERSEASVTDSSLMLNNRRSPFKRMRKNDM